MGRKANLGRMQWCIPSDHARIGITNNMVKNTRPLPPAPRRKGNHYVESAIARVRLPWSGMRWTCPQSTLRGLPTFSNTEPTKPARMPPLDSGTRQGPLLQGAEPRGYRRGTQGIPKTLQGAARFPSRFFEPWMPTHSLGIASTWFPTSGGMTWCLARWTCRAQGSA